MYPPLAEAVDDPRGNLLWRELQRSAGQREIRRSLELVPAALPTHREEESQSLGKRSRIGRVMPQFLGVVACRGEAEVMDVWRRDRNPPRAQPFTNEGEIVRPPGLLCGRPAIADVSLPSAGLAFGPNEALAAIFHRRRLSRRARRGRDSRLALDRAREVFRRFSDRPEAIGAVEVDLGEFRGREISNTFVSAIVLPRSSPSIPPRCSPAVCAPETVSTLPASLRRWPNAAASTPGWHAGTAGGPIASPALAEGPSLKSATSSRTTVQILPLR